MTPYLTDEQYELIVTVTEEHEEEYIEWTKENEELLMEWYNSKMHIGILRRTCEFAYHCCVEFTKYRQSKIEGI